MGNTTYHHQLSNFVHACWCLMNQLEVVEIKHVYHEANGCADLLTNKGSLREGGLLIYHVVPLCIKQKLYDNARGIQYRRQLYEYFKISIIKIIIYQNKKRIEIPTLFYK